MVGAVIDSYDAALFDLDGVVYLGPAAVVGAAAGINALAERGITLGYVTNNAARPPSEVAKHLRELGIDAETHDVVTSAQAAATLLRERFGAGALVLLVGGAGIIDALEAEGLHWTRSADDNPVAVIQGYAEDLTWAQLNEAAIAINRGAHWVATNTDPTRPTDRGLVPGNGAAVAAVRIAVPVEPEVAGKPYRPLMVETVARLQAARPIFVGDRTDTDIGGAVRSGMDSMLVLSGSHGARDLLVAPPTERPTHLGRDLRDLLLPGRFVEIHTDTQAVRCGLTTASVVDGAAAITGPLDADHALDALWALAHLTWAAADQGTTIDVESVLCRWEQVFNV